ANVTVGTDANMCSATGVALGSPVFSDNCPGSTVGNNAPATFPLGVTTVTWTVTDASGNTATATQTVTVQDRQLPTITTCPAAKSDNVSANVCSAAVPDVTGEVVATDNCTAASELTITQMPAAGTLLTPGVHTIVVTVKDIAGNETTCNVSFTVIDNIDPVIVTCPAPQAAFAGAQCTAMVPNFTTGVVATDNCSGVSPVVITQMPAAGTPVGLGVTTVTITVTDINGNTATCTTTFTVTDNTAPTITCPANISVVEDNGCSLAMVNVGMPTASDNCGTVTITGVRSDGKELTDPYLLGTTTITWTATDEAGLTATCDQTVTVVKGPGTLLVNYTFVGLNGFPFNANETATGITSNVTSSVPFVPQASGTSTGPLAFKQNIGTNPLLNMQPSAGETTRYHEFVISGDNLKYYKEFKIYFQAGRQPQGATEVEVRYSTDGTNYTTFGSIGLPTQNQWYEAFFDLSEIDALNGNDLENLYIRLYANGAIVERTNNSTRLEIDNFQVAAFSTGVALTCNDDVNVTVTAGADCSATVEVTAPMASSLCGEVMVTGSRSDGMELSDPYPIGTTIITWTATDPGGNTATCAQNIVVSGLIVAADDAFATTGSAGIVGNVLANDLLDCAPATVDNVVISVVTPSENDGVVLDVMTGNVVVDVNTPIGTYTIVYRICEIGGNPARCDDATVTVTIDGVLPATGLRLMANRAGNDVNLNWVTISEQNTSHFILERSLDGTTFSPIPVGNRVAAAGNSNSQRSYNQVDRNMVAPVVYYRVRLFDNDGSFRLSNVVAVRMAQGREFRVYPNPVVNMFTVEFAENGVYRVDLISASGQLIQLHREVVVTNSSPSITIPRNNQISGMYELRVTNTTTGKVSTVKLIYQPR
ncbi:MAG TPA: T9SS type A sorting domain-containing protein, partial [Phnomibacter sp.]|nr:T9SS type A sorting domain-containing protein [Phnomibacter sp.]